MLRLIAACALAGMILLPLGAVLTVAQDQEQAPPVQNLTLPSFVVIYRFKMNVWQAGEPQMEFRILIHAKNEQDAIMRSLVYMVKKYGATIDVEALELMEVGQPRK